MGAETKRTAVFVLVTVFVWGTLLSAGCGESEESKKFTAQVMAQEFVKDRLKSPSTAEFPQYEWSVFGPDETGLYWCLGPVDAQNGFGAMIRMSCSVHLREVKDEPGVWELEELDIYE